MNAAQLNAALLAQNAALSAELAAARVERAELLAKIDLLLARVDALIAKKSKKLPAPAAAPPAPVLPPPELASRPQPPVKPEPAEAPERKARTPKARASLPSSEETVRPDRCAHCGGDRLTMKDVQESELIDYVKGYVRRRHIRRVRCRCADCAKVTSPPVPQACLPKTHFSAAFVAFVLHGKYTQHLALERIRGDLARQGYPMASSTISDLAQRALDELHEVAKVIWRQVRALPYNHSDATGIPVVSSDQDKTHLGQMFFFGWERWPPSGTRRTRRGPRSSGCSAPSRGHSCSMPPARTTSRWKTRRSGGPAATRTA